MSKIGRIVYAVVVSLFLVGLLAQVYLVGLSILGGRPSWDAHIGLGHGLGLLGLLMVAFAYLGRLPRPLKPLTWLSFGVYILLADVVIFVRSSAPLVAALHPVLALILFGLMGTLVTRAWGVVRESTSAREAPAMTPAPETAVK
jgi:hypothetical protein